MKISVTVSSRIECDGNATFDSVTLEADGDDIENYALDTLIARATETLRDKLQQGATK